MARTQLATMERFEEEMRLSAADRKMRTPAPATSRVALRRVRPSWRWPRRQSP